MLACSYANETVKPRISPVLVQERARDSFISCSDEAASVPHLLFGDDVNHGLDPDHLLLNGTVVGAAAAAAELGQAKSSKLERMS